VNASLGDRTGLECCFWSWDVWYQSRTFPLIDVINVYYSIFIPYSSRWDGLSWWELGSGRNIPCFEIIVPASILASIVVNRVSV
jgi:hypothetical protein